MRTIRRADGTEEVVTESDPERLALQRGRLALEFLARRWPHDYARRKVDPIADADVSKPEPIKIVFVRPDHPEEPENHRE